MSSSSSEEPSESQSATPGSLRELGRDAMIYGLGIFLSRAASFFMLPIYTRFLTPADYGILELLDLTLSVTEIVVAAGMTRGVLRFYYKTEDEEKRRSIVSTAFFLYAGLKVIGAGILLAAAPWISDLLLGKGVDPNFVRIVAGSFVFDAMVTVPMLYLQARRKPIPYVGASVSKLVLQLGLNIWLVVFVGAGVIGVLWSTFTATLLVGTALTVWMLRETGARLSRDAIGDLRRFGVPYQLVAAGSFVLTFGDRFFLKAFAGLDAVGIYSLAYKFGFLLVTVATVPFMKAWNPQRFRLTRESRELRDRRYNEGFFYLDLVLVTTGVGICLYVSPVLTVMSDPSFRGAASLVPIIVIAYLAQSWKDVLEFGIDVSEETRYSTYAAWITVGVIVALYFALVPMLAGLGAALATAAAFVLRTWLCYRYAQRLWPISYRWGRHWKLLLYGAGVTAAFFVVEPAGTVAQLILSTGLLCVYALVAWLDILDREERRTIWNFVLSLRSRLALGSAAS